MRKGAGNNSEKKQGTNWSGLLISLASMLKVKSRKPPRNMNTHAVKTLIENTCLSKQRATCKRPCSWLGRHRHRIKCGGKLGQCSTRHMGINLFIVHHVCQGQKCLGSYQTLTQAGCAGQPHCSINSACQQVEVLKKQPLIEKGPQD